MRALRTFSALFATLLVAGFTSAQGADQDVAPASAPWGAPAAQVASGAQSLALLHDNGKYITGFGNGAGAANTSAIEAGFVTFGYGCQLSSTSNNRVADDFTVPAAQTWVLSSMTWRAYQTGAPSNGTLTSANVRIWQGGSPAFGGTVLAGDITTNRMTGMAWSGVYRVESTSPGDISRAIIDATIDMSWVPPLPEGTYWVDVQFTGNLSSGPWSNPTVAAHVLDNAEQFTSSTGTWQPVADAASGAFQDFPFILDGIDSNCPAVTTYCTPKITSSGCPPLITTSGSPKPGGGFIVRGTLVDPGHIGVFFYAGNGPAAIPLQGGFLCVAPPVQRLPASVSNGFGPCLGAYTYNLDALVTSLPTGSVMHGQFWFRDPGAASGTGLSNGVTFTVCP